MATTAQPRLFQNFVLRSLDYQSLERLQLTPVTVQSGQKIAAPDHPIRRLFFFEAGCAGVGVLTMDGNVIETAILGHRSVVGADALLGVCTSRQEVIVRSPGHGFVCATACALEEFSRHGKFHDLILRSIHTQLIQSSQIAACNACHDAKQRLCRWLLHSQDESGVPQVYATQESLGEALGIRRTTVSIIMEQLQKRGLVHYKRGQISLLDRSALEACACECYKVLRDAPPRQEPLKYVHPSPQRLGLLDYGRRSVTSPFAMA